MYTHSNLMTLLSPRTVWEKIHSDSPPSVNESTHTGWLAPLERRRPSPNGSLTFPHTVLDPCPPTFYQHAVTHQRPKPGLKIEALHPKIEMMNSQKGFVSSHKNEGEKSQIEKLSICEHISVNETRSVWLWRDCLHTQWSSHGLCLLQYSNCSKGLIQYCACVT